MRSAYSLVSRVWFFQKPAGSRAQSLGGQYAEMSVPAATTLSIAPGSVSHWLRLSESVR